MTPIDRRRFLRLMAGTVGGTLVSSSLVGCGIGTEPPGGDGPFPVLPSGYRFYRVKTTGETLGAGSRSLTLDYLYGGVHLASNGILTVEGRDAARQGGIFQMGLDLDAQQPRVDWERTALLVGDTLRDGRVVSTYESYDVDDIGSIAAVLEADGSDAARHYGGGLYLDRYQGGFEPLLIAGQTFAGGELYATGILGDVDVHTGHDVLLVAHHERSSETEHAPVHSIVHLPGASLNEGVSLVTSGELVDGTDHVLSDIGLIDLHDQGAYAYQGRTTAIDEGAGPLATSALAERHAILTGNVTAPQETRLLTSTSSTLLTGELDGDVHYGPRVGPTGQVASIVDLGDEREALLLDGAQRTALRRRGPAPRHHPRLRSRVDRPGRRAVLHAVLEADRAHVGAGRAVAHGVRWT
ncbi:MAG: hypothetical protein U5J97_10220 [Trueperaceae bacterium]|nr:hypothetical protein [Trueperaceae bacterium]